MKLHRFMGNLIDLELISRVYSDFGTEPSPLVNIHIEFILGASPITIQLSRGYGLGGPPHAGNTVARYRAAVFELEQAWAACGRVIQGDQK